MPGTDDLSDSAAVRALAVIVDRWFTERGSEPYVLLEGTRRLAGPAYRALPNWAVNQPTEEASSDEGAVARFLLGLLIDAKDDEVSLWTAEALKRVRETGAQVIDPLTSAIWGAIIIGAILAARVKKVGATEFYEGVPKEIGEFLKAVPGFFKGE